MEEQLEGIGNSTIEVSNDLMNLSKQLDNIRDQHQQGLFHYRQNICIERFHKLISCTLICCLLIVITPIFHVFYPSYCTLKLNKVNVNETIHIDLIFKDLYVTKLRSVEMKRLIDIGFSDMKEMYENMAKEMEAVKKELDRLSKYEFIPITSLCKPNHISIHYIITLLQRYIFITA